MVLPFLALIGEDFAGLSSANQEGILCIVPPLVSGPPSEGCLET